MVISVRAGFPVLNPVLFLPTLVLICLTLTDHVQRWDETAPRNSCGPGVDYHITTTSAVVLTYEAVVVIVVVVITISIAGREQCLSCWTQ